MPDWLDFRLTKIRTAYVEFPSLLYWSAFYLVLVILSAFLYMPLLKLAYSFNPLQNLIAENASWLVWGKCVIPPVIALFCYLDISERHDEKYLKKHRQLPKWVR